MESGSAGGLLGARRCLAHGRAIHCAVGWVSERLGIWRVVGRTVGPVCKLPRTASAVRARMVGRSADTRSAQCRPIITQSLTPYYTPRSPLPSSQQNMGRHMSKHPFIDPPCHAPGHHHTHPSAHPLNHHMHASATCDQWFHLFSHLRLVHPATARSQRLSLSHFCLSKLPALR